MTSFAKRMINCKLLFSVKHVFLASCESRKVFKNKKDDMRKTIITICLLLSLTTDAMDWGRVLNAIAYVESKNDPRAVCGDQVGLLQIRPIMVKDCNRILEKRGSNKRYTLRDRYSASKSREMFVLYQSHYNPKGSIERAIRLWNGGSGYSVRATQKYYQKVRRAMK